MLRFKDTSGHAVWIDETRIIMAREWVQEPLPSTVIVTVAHPGGTTGVEVDCDAKKFQQVLDSAYDDEVSFSSDESLGDTFISMGFKQSD